MACFLRSTARRGLAAFCFLTFAGFCAIAQTAAVVPPLLPKHFAGWTEQSAAKTGTSPATADAANADVLDEYGLKEFAGVDYQRGSDGVHVRVLRFADATGAYGAFTFYRKPEMKPLEIGRGAAGDAREVVFWSGTNLVDATFSAEPPKIVASLKSLAAALPTIAGSSGVPPTLPDYLPAKLLDKATVHYAIGPAAYLKGGGVLPPDVIGFNRDAEAVTAQYTTSSGRGTLTLLEYPTPQMAVQEEKSLNALLKAPLPAGLQKSASTALRVYRSGPLVALTSGSFSANEAQALLAQVKYQVDVTWNRGSGSNSEIKKAASMLIGIAYLTAFFAVCALVMGFFLGGGRALWRTMRGKPASSLHEEEFIRLDLSDWHESTRKAP